MLSKIYINVKVAKIGKAQYKKRFDDLKQVVGKLDVYGMVKKVEIFLKQDNVVDEDQLTYDKQMERALMMAART